MVWNFKPNVRPFRFCGHTGAVNCVDISPSGNTIISGSQDNSIRIWNNTVEGYSQVIKSHSAPVKTVNFSPDGTMLLSGSDDKTLKCFQLSDRKFLWSITGHSNWVNSAQWSPDSRLICSASMDKHVKLWDVTTRNNVADFTYDEGKADLGVNSVKFHPDGTCVGACSDDKTIQIWDIRSSRLIQRYDTHDPKTCPAKTVNKEWELAPEHLKSQKPQFKCQCDARVNSISFHPNGRYLLSANANSPVKIWDLRQGHILYTLYGHEGPTNSCQFSPNGDYFVTGGSDQIVMIWKSNLNPFEKEVIDDFGGKLTNL
jgi:centriolar protein POC1